MSARLPEKGFADAPPWAFSGWQRSVKLPGAKVTEVEGDRAFVWEANTSRVTDTVTGAVLSFKLTDPETLCFAAIFERLSDVKLVIFGNYGLLASHSGQERVAFHVWRTAEWRDGHHFDVPAPLIEIAKFLNAVASGTMGHEGRILLIDTRDDQGGIRVSP